LRGVMAPSGTEEGLLPADGQYVAQAEETCNAIAKRLGLNAQELVRLNKDRYPGLRPHAKVSACSEHGRASRPASARAGVPACRVH